MMKKSQHSLKCCDYELPDKLEFIKMQCIVVKV